MFEKFITGGQETFRQRYAGTYGMFLTKGKRTLVQLTDISSDTVFFTDKNKIQYELRLDAEGDTGFEFIPPKSCWYNTDIGGMMVNRIPAKQFSRGICSKNTAVVTPDGKKFGVNFDTLEKLYLKSVDFATALKSFNDKKTNDWLALAPQFALWRGDGIFCFEQNIGEATITGKELVVKLKDNDKWTTEIQDVARRAKLTLTLK